MKQPLTFNWMEQPSIYCTAETINAKLKELASMECEGKIRKIPFYTARNWLRLIHTYCVSTTMHTVCIRVFINAKEHAQYMFNDNRGTSVSEKPEMSGMQAYDYIETMFQEEYGDDKSLFTSFSGVSYKEQYKVIKNCVPKPVSMINKTFTHRIIPNIHKADISSAYPSEGSKALPTLHGCVQIEGRVKPTEEYPFAFYINSHHMAILNEFSTVEWSKYRKFYTLYDEMFDDSVYPEEDITILCKCAPCSLANVFSKVYEQKENGNQIAKLGMNAAIGMFQKTSNPRLCHLSAVIIGRCCNRILKLAKKIEDKQSSVILIATDSIIWKGSLLEEAVDRKSLGSFTYEIHNGQFYEVGPKAYQVMDDSGCIHTKYSGMKNSEEKNSLKFGEMPDKSTRRYMIDSNGHVTEVNYII